MKNQAFNLLIGGLFLFTLISCGEDVDSYLEPDQAKIVDKIELSSEKADVNGSFLTSEMSDLELTIVKTYSDGSEQTMTSGEMRSQISWTLSNNSMAVSQDQSLSGVRLQGIGTTDLKANYLPNSENGNRQIASNSLSIEIIDYQLATVEVVPAENYSESCPNSNNPETRVAVGCLMQFQAFAHYDNGLTSDITELVDWSIDDTVAANLLSDITSFEGDHSGKDWYPARSQYITENALANQKGLVLAYSIGSFSISIDYDLAGPIKSHTSGTVTVVSPVLYALSTQIAIPSEPSCSNDCIIYKNTSFNIEAKGIYDNDATTDDLMSKSSITISPSDPNIELVTNDVGGFTGKVNINYEAPDSVSFMISVDDLNRQIDAEIINEAIVSVFKEAPLGDEVYRLSNTDVYFQLDASYNNDQFTVLDQQDRKSKLNTIIFDQWEIDQTNYLSWQGSPWDPDKGYHAKTSGDETGDTIVTAKSAEYGDITWNLILDNNNANPVSLSISPTDNDNGTSYNIIGGLTTPFTATAIFNNETTEELDISRIEWDADQPCILDLVNPIQVPCITADGKVTTYENIDISVTTQGVEGDISTSIHLIVNNTDLEELSIESVSEIYGKESTLFSTTGKFENNRFHVLPDECVSWNASGFGSFYGSLFVAKDVSEDVSVEITAETSADCGSTPTPGRNMVVKQTTDFLLVKALPEISVTSNISPVNEGESFRLTFSKSISGFSMEITVPYSVSGTSQAGTDHSLVAGYATIPADQQNVTIDVDTIDDNLFETDETVIVTILKDGLINGRLSDNVNDYQKTVSILNNDSKPELLIEFSPSGDVSEDAGNVTASFTIVNPVYSGRDIPISFSISGDVSTDDYQIQDVSSDTIILPAGQNSIQLEFTILQKDTKESSEHLVIDFNISNDLVSVVSSTSADIRIDDVDSLSFKSLTLENQTCTKGETCRFDLPPLNADGPIVDVTLEGPGWASLIDGNTRIEVDTSIENTGVFSVCASDGTDDICLLPFSITISP
ncbi:MAG: hypothetical protein MJE63_09155 [Proteobacteria bacterium]|nr:hypothetical protein [Pseudomonadota bacterium]